MKKLLFSLLALVILASCSKQGPDMVSLDKPWKFSKGDDLAWKAPDFDDSKWDSISCRMEWERQNYAEYNGYGWYRIRFVLPKSVREQAMFKDSLQIILGKIDDTDQTFLNGKLIGQNGQSVSLERADSIGKFEGDPQMYSVERVYKLAANDPRINWGGENVLAVRCNDHFGLGGFIEARPEVRMVDLQDYLILEKDQSKLEMLDNNKLRKTLTFTNKHASQTFVTEVSVVVSEFDNEKLVEKATQKLEVPAGQTASVTFELNNPAEGQHTLTYTVTEKAGHSFFKSEELPYILTPKAPETPRFNGPKVTAARPGHDFLFRIPVSGVRPMTFTAQGLPEGLTLDAQTGIISGKVAKAGEYVITLTAKNDKGEASRELKIVIGDKLCLTPPMGWNSWNAWGLSVDEVKVKAAADAFVEKGLADYGWTYVNIDDGWEAPARNAKGEILSNEKFPDMKGLCDYVHSKGLKIGIYSSPGPQTCGKYLGSYQHELQDAKTWAAWGFDYIKYDWCAYEEVAKDHSLPELQKPYKVMQDALSKIDRDIVFSLCQYGWGNVWEWGESVNGQLWRTTGDIVDSWASLYNIGFSQTVQTQYAKPGHWNDPDMLIVGWVGWGPKLHPTRLTVSEQYTHISLWSMLAAPLLIGCDLSRLDDFTLNLLCNDEVNAVNQDVLGKQGYPIVSTPAYQIWMKELEDGSKAVALFNMNEATQSITLDLSKTGFNGEVKLRDLWRQKDMGAFNGSFTSKVPAHGVTYVKISK